MTLFSISSKNDSGDQNALQNDFVGQFIKFIFCEKATKFEKIILLFFINVNEVGDFFKFFGPSQNIGFFGRFVENFFIVGLK